MLGDVRDDEEGFGDARRRSRAALIRSGKVFDQSTESARILSVISLRLLLVERRLMVS